MSICTLYVSYSRLQSSFSHEIQGKCIFLKGVMAEVQGKTTLTCHVQDLSDKVSHCGPTVLRYVHICGKSEVRSSIQAEVNNKARWTRCRFAGCAPAADQCCEIKLNELQC